MRICLLSMNPPTNTVSLPIYGPQQMVSISPWIGGFDANWLWLKLKTSTIQCHLQPYTTLDHKQNHNHFYLPNVSIDKQDSGSIFSAQNASITVQQSTLVIWVNFDCIVLFCFLTFTQQTFLIHNHGCVEMFCTAADSTCSLELFPRILLLTPASSWHFLSVISIYREFSLWLNLQVTL